MKIIMDAMGGDNAPAEFLKGAFQAANEFGVEMILVGRGEELLRIMKQLGYDTLPQGVQIANADEVVDMHDDPATVLHTRKNSSMVLGLKMLADGMGDAFISAGNTGALLSAATLLVRRVKGIRRAAFGPITPTKSGSAVIIDAGANAECSPEFLLQFGCMGSYYAKKALNLEQPRVALLNNGTEDSKGTDLQKQAYGLLRQAGDKGVIRFVGNVEAREFMLGGADVLVCDGFSGNVLLKSIEGTAMYMSSLLKGIFTKNLATKLAAAICSSGIKELKELMDYRRVGGTMLIGISKPVIKAHGSSDALAVKNAVQQAIGVVNSGICDDIRDNVDKMILPRETQANA